MEELPIYRNSSVYDFGRIAKVRLKKIECVGNRTIYTYNLEDVPEGKSLVDSYFKLLVSEGWEIDFKFPICIAKKGGAWVKGVYDRQTKDMTFEL